MQEKLMSSLSAPASTCTPSEKNMTTVLISKSMVARSFALLFVTVFLTGCPNAPKNDQVVLEVQFYQGKPEAYPAVICTCSTEASGGSVEFGTTFRIDTKGTGNSDNGMMLG